MCHKSFPTPGDLKSHMYVHNGSWPFQCQVCKRGFSKQTNLRNHLFLHTGTVYDRARPAIQTMTFIQCINLKKLLNFKETNRTSVRTVTSASL